MDDLERFNRALSGYFVTTKDQSGTGETKVFYWERDAKHYATEFMSKRDAVSAKIDVFDHGDYLGTVWQAP